MTPTVAHARPPRWIAAIAAVALGLAVSLVGVTSAAHPAAAAPVDDAAGFLRLVNEARQAAGLAPVVADPAAAGVAQAWSDQMGRDNSLYHNPNLVSQINAQVTSAWQRIGENVGVGYSVQQLHDAFMASPGHRDNILGDFNRLGIGVTYAGGRIWVTQDFIKGPALAPPAPTGWSPRGSVDVIQRVPGALRVAGWSLDLDTDAPTDVHVYVGASGKAVRADLPRPDIAAIFPGYGSAHGFDITIPVLPGTYDVCVYGINAAGGGGTSVFSCRQVVANGAPVGSVDSVSWTLGRATISGWTLDPDVEWSIPAHVYVDGVGVPITADAPRADIANAFPGYGAAHGFSVTVPMSGGQHTVCVYGIGAGAGGNAGLGCRSVDMPADPRGALDAVWRVPGGVEASGWALDPETAQPIPVHLYVGSVGQAVSAATSRTDIARVFPGYGDQHGFDASVPAGAGSVQVCAYGIGTGAGGNSLLGCRTV